MLQPRERIAERLNPHQVRANEFRAYEAELRERISELETIVEARQTLEKKMDAEIENTHGSALLAEASQAKRYYSAHFRFLRRKDVSELFDLLAFPDIFKRTGRWIDEAQYFEECIDQRQWVGTIWAFMLYRTHRADLMNMLVEGWEDHCDEETIDTIRSWLDCAHCHLRPGWAEVVNYDHGLSGFFN